ncbi:MAG: flagellin lysine-N-methylase [Clostridia bacterium]|nr:flagellin lysine-N-methylase [Clostridia bacterium]
MKPVFVPNYYESFRCIAAACKHSCCVGWEIDVDADTLAYYDTVTGEMGKRLRASIDHEADPPCFRLTPDERCPFLNESGLCDLITELGEESLCHICDDHPRFRNVLSDRVELGLGLCCEAAAELILSQTEPFSVVELPPEKAARERHAHEDSEALDDLTDALIAHRKALLPLLTDRTKPLADRIRHVFHECDIDLSENGTDTFGSFSAIAALLRDMERLDPAWDAYLDALEELTEDPPAELNGEASVAYENLICYFLYRYMTTDAEYWPNAKRTRTAFAVLCALIIHAIHRATGGKDLDSLCETARMFSCEIEYSEENLERLMEAVGDALF